MSRLIDAHALFTFFCKFGNDAEWDTRGILYAIFTAPTVDAVPVVRCRDCKHFEKAGGSHCTLLNTEMGRHDFCNCAERRDTE